MTEGGSASVTVAADAQRVWALVADVTRMGEWSPENQGGEWLDGADRAVVGARFKGRNRRGWARWSTTCEVIEADPGRSFAFAVGSAQEPQTVWRFRFEPVGDDSVRVTEEFELAKPMGPLMRLATRVTTGVKDRHSDLEAGALATLEALKRAAESDARPA